MFDDPSYLLALQSAFRSSISRRISSDSEPIFLDLLPLTLEEIFIYELGGTEHEVKSIVL